MFCVYVMLLSTAKVRVGALLIKVRYHIEFTFILVPLYNTRRHTESTLLQWFATVYQKGSFGQQYKQTYRYCGYVSVFVQHITLTYIKYAIYNFSDAYYTCMLPAHHNLNVH